MSGMTAALTRILRRARIEGDQVGEIVGDDGRLYLKAFATGVINIEARPGDRPLTRADVDALRASLDETGYVEVESWIPRQGVSWLSDGLAVGVSMRIAPKGRLS